MPHSCPWEEPACSGESVRATETGDDGAPRPSGQGHSPSRGPAPRPRYGRGKTDDGEKQVAGAELANWKFPGILTAKNKNSLSLTIFVFSLPDITVDAIVENSADRFCDLHARPPSDNSHSSRTVTAGSSQ